MLLFLGTPRKPKPVAEDARSYFKHLVATYYALPPDEDRKELAGRIKTLIEDGEKEMIPIDWDYLFELEYLILMLMPKEMLARKKWVIRERFAEAVGKQSYQEYKLSKPPNHPEEALVADLGIVLDDLFWSHKLHTLWERQWKRLIRGIAFGFAGVTAAILAIAAGWTLLPPAFDVTLGKAVLTLGIVALAGMAGSLVSLIERFQRVPNAKKRTANLIGMEGGSAIVLQALMTGAVFALLMPLLFGSGMLAGDLFPEVAWAEGTTFLAGLAALADKGAAFAMLLIWCFAAGFAERLVPDLLNRLTPKAGTEQRKEDEETAPRPEKA